MHVLHWIVCFLFQMAGQPLPQVRDMLDAGADVHETDQCGRTPLLVAINHGGERIVRMLLNANSALERASVNGMTPIRAALELNCASVVER